MTTTYRRLGTENIEIVFSSPTATIQGTGGRALSTSNPGFITMRSNVNNQLIDIPLTSNVTFEDSAGTSVFAGSLFDFDTGDTTTVGVPFYLYAVADDNDANPTFLCCRLPSYTVTTAAILYTAAGGGADLSLDMLALKAITVGDYDTNAVQMIGSFSMDIDGADDWTIISVSTEYLGIGKYAEQQWVMPLGVYGARAGSLFLDNGGTAPTINTGSAQYFYTIDPFGHTLTYEVSAAMGGSPASAVDAKMVCPLIGRGLVATNHVSGSLLFSTGISQVSYRRFNNVVNASRFLHLFKGNDTLAKWQYDEFTSGDGVRISWTYSI